MALAGFVGLPLLVGAAGAALAAGSPQAWFLSLARPPATPPAWAFGSIWMPLSALMGVAAWLVWHRAGDAARPLRLWGWLVLVSAAWAPAFFGLHALALALTTFPPLLLLIAATAIVFARRVRLAGLLMLPYFGWMCYATYLAAGFWWMNPHA